MPFHEARYFPIRLAYLWDSTHNDTVDWAWDAYDEHGKFYYITARRGALLISREGELIHESPFGDESDSILSLDGLWELAGPLALFDRSLLDGGQSCICGYTYERAEVPEFCRRCECRVRGRRLVELYTGDVKFVDGKSGHENAAATRPELSWRFVDEYGRQGTLTWRRRAVDITAAASAAAPAIKAQFVIGNRRDGLGTADAILSHMTTSLSLELDFSALECATCALICLSDQKKCPGCGATERGRREAET